MADVASTLRAWSSTPGSNSPSGSTNIGAGLDDNLREIQAVTRKFLASKGTAIASAATMDLTTMDGYYASVTGNTTVTGLGTEVAGISYYLRFASTPQITHGASAINLAGAASRVMVAGDVMRVTSEGSGVWVETGFWPNAAYTGTGSQVRATAPTLSGANLGSSTVATTQTAGDNSTKIATTAYVDGRVSAHITAQATTSGTTFSFTIPTWANAISLTMSQCSLTGSDNFIVQLADAGGAENTGYTGVFSSLTNTGSGGTATLSAGFAVGAGGAGASVSGSMLITRLSADRLTWACQGVFGNTGDSTQKMVGGIKSLSAELTGVVLTRTGSDTFDAGSVSVVYW